ncbi:MAG: hypothetical protein KBC64_00675 [Simkaniaceae bacterium]|nr:hypothetical protein [Simkaniaceae bacterium]
MKPVSRSGETPAPKHHGIQKVAKRIPFPEYQPYSPPLSKHQITKGKKIDARIANISKRKLAA